MKEHEDNDAGAAVRGERAALLMRLGGLAFAVYSDECECVTPWAEPAPLPHAPAPVLGVVTARGRVRTVIPPARPCAALGAGFERRPAECALLASLAGDEQLALALAAPGPLPLTGVQTEPRPESPALPLRAAFRLEGETVYLL